MENQPTTTNRLTVVRPPFEISYGWDGPPQNQNPAIATFLGELAQSAGLNPKPGFFLQVFHTGLLYEEKYEEAAPPNERHNDLAELVDPSGEGMVINLGFVTGMSTGQMLAACRAWDLPHHHLQLIMQGLNPANGQQVAAPAPEWRLSKGRPEYNGQVQPGPVVITPEEALVWAKLLLSDRQEWVHHGHLILNTEQEGVRHLEAMVSEGTAAEKYLASNAWNGSRTPDQVLDGPTHGCLVDALNDLQAYRQTLALEQRMWEPWLYCVENEKSTAFAIEYMQDVAQVDHDTVLEFLLANCGFKAIPND